MPRQQTEATSGRHEPAHDDFEQFTSYEDGNALVICDRENPNAWIRSDVTETRSA